MRTQFKLALLGAMICMFAEGVRTWPTPFDEKPVSIFQIIEDYESDLVQTKSFNNVMNAINQYEE